MIYTRMTGRLGNQLFYYAISRNIQLKSKKNGSMQKLCFNFYDVYEKNKGLESIGWEDSLKYFKVKDYVATSDTDMNSQIKKESTKLRYFLFRIFWHVQIIFSRLKWKSLHLNKAMDWFSQMVLGGYFHRQYEDVLVRFPVGSSRFFKDIFVMGRYENPGWFDEIKGILQDEIVPKFNELEHNTELYSIIRNSNSVCISIRRGDYLLPENDGYNVCNKEYFYKAIKEIKKKVERPIFIVFSDEIEWAKSIDLFENNDIVYFERGTDPVWEKLRLMYSCKHFIISNSTFSWWAQYLSRNSNKIVVCPDIWYKPSYRYPLIDDEFIQIHVN